MDDKGKCHLDKEMDATRRNQLANLPYVTPETLLMNSLPIVSGIQRNSAVTKRLSVLQRQQSLEKYQAGLLAFLLKRISSQARIVVDVTVYAEKEVEDCDCVIKRVVGEQPAEFRLVQLKQLPCRAKNQQIELQALIDRLQGKYGDRIVAVWINRDVQIDLSQLRFDGLIVEQLWLFGLSASKGIATLHGGHVCDLKSGICQAGRIIDGEPKVGVIRFSPASTCQPREIG